MYGSGWSYLRAALVGVVFGSGAFIAAAPFVPIALADHFRWLSICIITAVAISGGAAFLHNLSAKRAFDAAEEKREIWLVADSRPDRTGQDKAES